MRVVHLITGLATGGAEVMLFKLLATMDRAAFQQRVVALTAGGAVAARIAALGIPVTTLGLRPGSPNPVGLLRLWRELRRDKPDVLQTWLYHADLLGTAGAALAGVPRLAWNVRCSTMDARYERGMGGVLVGALARLSRRPDVVIFNSAAGKVLHTKLGYRPRRWEVVPNGFDIDALQPAQDDVARLRTGLRIDDQAPVIGLVARYDPVKDHATFLRAAAILLAEFPVATFVLAGRGCDSNNATLTRLIRDLGIEASVRLLGERTDIPTVNATFSIATCCSTGEGFPNAVGEAMAGGKPIVMTDVGDAREIVGDAGEIVPPSNPAALAEGWLSLLRLPAAERARIGAVARHRVEQYFDIRGIAARYEALYRAL